MNDEPASKPIGHYRYIVAGGPMYGKKNVYAARWHGLPSGRRVFQVLIAAIGGLCWINIEPSEFTPC